MTFEALDCAAGTFKVHKARAFERFQLDRSYCYFCRIKGSKKISPMPPGANGPSRPMIVDYNHCSLVFG
ncbi:hypothetical protein CDL15_Pgr025200 [Punica granatum]|uniref:Uncharacterized protein n=1 Tax=Punica granatum TaxID=22663 RepID=A0A218W8Y5_PUNGR|nr:hypothetical protein CDL15_Pgr025200 [Punica granatum]